MEKPYSSISSLNPFKWILLILETIGRTSYRSVFYIIRQTFSLIASTGLIFVKTYKNTYRQLSNKQLSLSFPKSKKKLPSFPRLSIPKTTLPKISLPKPSFLKFSIPKISLPRAPRPHFPSFHLSLIKKLAILLFIALSSVFYFYILKDLPSPTDLVAQQPTLSTKIYDRNHQLLFTFYKEQNRSLISLNDIPNHFKLATLAIEDSQFYQHKGLSWKGIFRSLESIVFKGDLQGGSTITQQLVKNVLLTPERTIQRKLKELILSLEVELLFSKDEIFEMYLNQVAYGGTAYGAEQAAQTYFGKSIKDLNLAESALLAGLPASPTIYSPFGSNPYLSIYRQHQVLNRMVEEQYIAPQEAALAKQQKISLAPQYTNIKAPHFVMYIKDILVEQYGQTMVEQGGLEVITSLDLSIQEKAQEIVTQEINQLYPLNITNGSALVTQPQTGEILAMIGSRDYFDLEQDGQVNLTTSLRQPGSSIKPVNYAYALEHGFTAASIIQDTPVTYSTPGSPPYSPVNYDSKFHGPVTLRSALANSYNIPAVKLLASYGVDKMIDQGQKMGITTWTQPERYGLSLTLGGAEVKMTDMAVVFGVFANNGYRVDLHPILSVTDSNGKVLQDFSCQSISKISLPQPIEAATTHLNCNPKPVIQSNTAHIISDILSDYLARAPAFGTRTYLNVPDHQVAVKTGTTNDKKDNWTIGYTQDLLTAVWVGNNDNSPMSQVASGVTGASPIWHKIMVELLKDSPSHQFISPSNLIKVDICTLTGQLTCDGCPSKTEYFSPGTEPTQHCSSEVIKQTLEKKEQEKQQRDQLLQGTSSH